MKLKVYIHKYISNFMAGEIWISNHPNTKDIDMVLVGDHEFEFDMPDVNMTAEKVKNLESKLEVLKEAFYKKEAEIKAEIQTLQCLENCVTE